MTRRLRSATHETSNTGSTSAPNTVIKLTPVNQTRLPGLTTAETRLLRKKQHRLRASKNSIRKTVSSYGANINNALSATLIFAQHEAGTAVCIDPNGWILTCAHCFGEDDQEWRENRPKWLLDYAGLAVQVECRVWDGRRDLALARIIRVEGDAVGVPEIAFISLHPATSSGVYGRAHIVCIGQPGADDLESETPRETDYDLVEISEGRLKGLVPGADPQDNSEIGTLKHDAWTYWGHSGAPLVCRDTGALLGLHSSWDDNTAMRHGVPLVAIKEFLELHLPSCGEDTISEEKEIEPEVIVIDSD
ncbi:trypsin-like cysteine/serine peptidase domain-containing protein [Aspergillus cavernicola]|uniref:Trypsin-like cysteine/serine peptidase domain-containing protein n=1 Tax=Aspergillus cavernicola TaxID=176166 RepID=A0ABR4HD88_9EURO